MRKPANFNASDSLGAGHCDENVLMGKFLYGSELNPNEAAALGRYRHRIFIERLGWTLPALEASIERDQYDRDDTVYVLARGDDGVVHGCARLLRTTRPYLLKEHFAALLEDGMRAPDSPDVWELSRFAATPDCTRCTPQDNLLQGARPMLARVVRCARDLQARRLIGVTFVSVERLFRRLGVRIYRAGPVQCIDGRKVVACWIDIDEQTLSALDIGAPGPEPGGHERAVCQCI